jgi:hypothetical protein
MVLPYDLEFLIEVRISTVLINPLKRLLNGARSLSKKQWFLRNSFREAHVD